MSPRDLLAKVYDKVHDQIDETLDSAEDFASGFLEEFEASLDALVDQASDLLDSDTGNYLDINETFLSLVEAVYEAGEEVADRLAQLMQAWTTLCAGIGEAGIDFLTGLFAKFVDNLDQVLSVVADILNAVTNFEEFFVALALSASADPSGATLLVESVFLPVAVAALLAPSIGPPRVANAFLAVLNHPAGSLRQHVSVFEVGVPQTGYEAWQVDTLGSTHLKTRYASMLESALLCNLQEISGLDSLLPGNLVVPNATLNNLFQPALAFFTDIVRDYVVDLQELFRKLIEHLLEQADNNDEIEWRLLELARFTPVGIVFIAVATAYKLLTNPVPFANLILNPIEEDPNLKVLRLPRPDEYHKYVILSDIHRDAKSDQRPPFQFGSIDHFLPNHALYLEILQRFDAEGYTIIEAGDCEELWFHRSFGTDLTSQIRSKLSEIVNETHAEIYDLLARLHRQERYFRVFGNHDSYLRNPEIFAVLNARMNPDGDAPFQIFDFVLLESVKTMHDVLFYLGLDSEPNQETKPLIVTHGHQWDFWNCDANNILGKLIVSAIVTPLDMLDDPIRDVAGISSTGSPAMNFKAMLSDTPIYNSWQSYEPAVNLTDQVQHMEDLDRRFSDDIQYSETLASLMGNLIPIRPNADDACLIPFPDNRCLFNLLSIGHTHNPHNEPYYDLKKIPVVREILLGIEVLINASTLGLLDIEVGNLKSNYLNSGVSGWYDQCVWGIDLGVESHCTGQPKLVNWTYNTRVDRPNHMDWELPHIQRMGQYLPGDDVDRSLNEFIDNMTGVFSPLGKRTAQLGGRAAAPVERVTAELLARWKPINLRADFSSASKASYHNVISLAVAQLFYGVMVSASKQQSSHFDVSIRLHPVVSRELSRLLKSPLVQRTSSSSDDRLVAAIGILAVLHDIGVHGLRRTGDPLPHGADSSKLSCLNLLLLLAQFRDVLDGYISTSLDFRGTAFQARIAIDAKRRGRNIRALPAPSPRKDLSRRNLRPHKRRKSKDRPRGEKRVPVQRRADLRARLYVKESGQPLANFKLRVVFGDGRQDARVLATARTASNGYALFELDRDDLPARSNASRGGRKQGLYLTLHNRDDKVVHRVPIKPPSTGQWTISIFLTRAQLIAFGLLPKSKARSAAEKRESICGYWKKRLTDKRDLHAADDLCLNDLVLQTIEGLEHPKTELQKKTLSELSTHTKDETLLAGIVQVARQSRSWLRECLGDDYPKCQESPESLKELGEMLLKKGGRFAPVKNLFADPLPNPLDALGSPKAGTGIRGGAGDWDKDCIGKYETGSLDPAIAAVMDELYPFGELLPPSVNLVHVWDAGFGGGDIVRRCDIHDKELTIRSLVADGGTLEVVDREIDLDVELDSEDCLVEHADDAGRQVVFTDVRPGQVVTLFGSGFVADRAVMRVDFQSWKAEYPDGKLVPDDPVTPVFGFSNSDVAVHGGNAPPPNATTQSYNGDAMIFTWPEQAAQQGLYKIRFDFENQSGYPTEINQNPADCTIQVNHDNVFSQEVYFVVLPAVSSPPIRIAGRGVECVNLTDPEGFLGITWPDDVFLTATCKRNRLVFNTDDQTVDIANDESITKDDSFLFWEPSLWSPNLQVFPDGGSFTQLDFFEFVVADFHLDEVEGEFDKAVILVMYTAIIIVVTLLIAAIVIAIAVALIVLIEAITLGAATPVILAVLGFLFGAMFTALAGTTAAVVSVVNGADQILSHTQVYDGSRLAFRMSPIRFHRLLWPGDEDLDQGVATEVTGEVSFSEEVANDALGGSYKLEVVVESGS